MRVGALCGLLCEAHTINVRTKRPYTEFEPKRCMQHHDMPSRRNWRNVEKGRRDGRDLDLVRTNP